MESIFILPDPEVERLLADNGIDLIKELRKRGLDVKGTREADPATSGERDLVLVILASGVAFAAISHGIAQIINALAGSKAAETTEVTTSPKLDRDGNPVKGPDGQPLFDTWTRKEVAALAPRNHASGVEVEFIGLKVKLSSSSKAPTPDTPP